MKVLVSPWWLATGIADLRSRFPQVEIATANTPADTAREIADADVVFGNIDGAGFAAAKQLRWIQSYGAGVEWIARVPELISSNVVVTNTRGAHAATIAEHAFGMLLTLTRGLRTLGDQQRERVWRRPTGVHFVGLSGLTLGVVGLGRIGSAIAQRGHGFDMHVIAVDTNDVPRASYIEEFWNLDGLPKLLAKSDVLAIATPLTPETRGMFGPTQLAMLRPSAFLVLVSRGGIVDQPALCQALAEGRLAGAAIDVTDPEPLPAEHELWGAPNLIISPHCSGSSRQTDDQVWGIFKENLARYLAGQPLNNLVDKRRGY